MGGDTTSLLHRSREWRALSSKQEKVSQNCHRDEQQENHGPADGNEQDEIRFFCQPPLVRRAPPTGQPPRGPHNRLVACRAEARLQTVGSELPGQRLPPQTLEEVVAAVVVGSSGGFPPGCGPPKTVSASLGEGADAGAGRSFATVDLRESVTSLPPVAIAGVGAGLPPQSDQPATLGLPIDE